MSRTAEEILQDNSFHNFSKSEAKAIVAVLKRERALTTSKPRRRDGKYAFSNMSLICKCGARLGDHIAEYPHENDATNCDKFAPTPSSTVGELDQGDAAVASPSNGHPGSVDLTNHHNALKCPYCNPDGLTFAAPRSVEALVACEPTEDQVMAIIRKHGDRFRKAMTTTKWKDGIDISEPNYDAMVFACDIAALYASPPPPDTAVREALKDAVSQLLPFAEDGDQPAISACIDKCRKALAALPPDAGSRT